MNRLVLPPSFVRQQQRNLVRRLFPSPLQPQMRKMTTQRWLGSMSPLTRPTGTATLPHCGIQRRNFSPTALHRVKITYEEPDGKEKTVDAKVGENLMQVAHDNNIELEGACGGELACSTCHLIFEKEIFDTLPTMDGEEEDMLDLAFEVTETSRLGCQILVREEFEGMKVKIPKDEF